MTHLPWHSCPAPGYARASVCAHRALCTTGPGDRNWRKGEDGSVTDSAGRVHTQPFFASVCARAVPARQSGLPATNLRVRSVCLQRTQFVCESGKHFITICLFLSCLHVAAMQEKVSVFPITSGETDMGPSTQSVGHRTQTFLERPPLGTLQVPCGARALSGDNEAQDFTDGGCRLFQN